MSANSVAVAIESSTRLHPDRVRLVSLPPQLYLDPRVLKGEGFMRRNLHLKLGLSELAGAIALSPSRFSHLFKVQAGLSPAQYLKCIRLQKAKDLLEGTDFSIKEVAGKVGLDPSRLSKSFKEKYGMTPLQHRFGTLQSDLGVRKHGETQPPIANRAQDEPVEGPVLAPVLG